MDGIDAALIETDGDGQVKAGPALSVPFTAELRDLLWRSVQTAKSLRDRDARPEPLDAAERELTDAHARAVEQLLADHRIAPGDVDVIGFHGQTVLHRPEIGLTLQIGDGARLADSTGIQVVCDLRANDMMHGGEGAPFAPVYHQALARTLPQERVAFLNLGGVANVTWVRGGDPLIAFDTGPANGLIDQWIASHSGAQMDADGAIAAAGAVDAAALGEMLKHPYFRRPPPKSLDRFDFDLAAVQHLNEQNGAATLTAFTAASVARAAEHLPGTPELWVACGGGRRNPTLMAALSETLDGAVVSAEGAGFRGDTIEAEAFAYLAARSLKGLPLSFPGTTGVAEPMTGGVLHSA